MRFWRDAVLGLFFGIAGITPGLSGGAIAVAMGIYEPIIRALSSLPRNPRQSLTYLFPLGAGLATGVLLFSRVMEMIMAAAPNQVILVFIGLVGGSLPGLVNEANRQGFRRRYLLIAVLAVVVLWRGSHLLAWPRALGGDFNSWHYAYFGMVYALGSVVPGISASFILIYVGAFDDLLRAVSTIHLPVLVPAAFGFAVGAMLLIRLVERIFSRYHGFAYYAILGFLLGSTALIWPGLSDGAMLVADFVALFGGVAISTVLVRFCAQTN